MKGKCAHIFILYPQNSGRNQVVGAGNVHNNLAEGPCVFIRPVVVLVFRKFFCGLHKVVPYVGQVVSPSKCSGCDLASRSSSLICLILLILLGKPRSSYERQSATEADSR